MAAGFSGSSSPRCDFLQKNALRSLALLLLLHAPEGFVHPMLSALMSKAVPEDAQGALQGGISALMNLAMLAGTLFFAQVFGWFLSEAAPFRSTDMAFFIASGVLAVALALFFTNTRASARRA